MNNESSNEERSGTPEAMKARMTLAAWLDNFWYHHKFGTIVSLVALITVIICAAQMCSREKYDLHVMYCGSKSFNQSETDSLCREIASHMKEDLNGDGKVNVELLNIVWLSDFYQETYQDQGLNVNLSSNVSAKEQFNAEMQNGQNVICLLDVDLYEETQKNTGIFETWQNLFGETPENAYDDCAIFLSDLSLGQTDAFSGLPETTVLCIRKNGEVNLSMSKEVRAKYYQYHVDAVKALLVRDTEAPSPEQTKEAFQDDSYGIDTHDYGNNSDPGQFGGYDSGDHTDDNANSGGAAEA